MVRSAARSFAERALGLAATSLAVGSLGTLRMSFQGLKELPRASRFKTPSKVPDRKMRFTRRSSSEW